MAIQQYEILRIRGLDCRDIVEQWLGKPAVRSGKTNLYKCPFHNERKGFSFVVDPDGWKCFGRCNQAGDAIAFVQKKLYCTFEEAVTLLTGQKFAAAKPVISPAPSREDIPPSAEWQAYAQSVILEASQTLHTELGVRAMNYLHNQRGLEDDVIQGQSLGYIPARRGYESEDYKYGRVLYPNWRLDDKPVRIPCGILIPHKFGSSVWNLRVRRPPGMEPKYLGVRGGKMALYNAGGRIRGLPALIVEGEFDALVAWQVLFDQVNVWAIAGAANAKLAARWTEYLIDAPAIYTRFDADGAGEKATQVLGALSARVKPLTLPKDSKCKDITDFYLMYGSSGIKAWFEQKGK